MQTKAIAHIKTGIMRHLLLTILTMIFISNSGLSQNKKAVFFSYDLGHFYLYVNDQLVERSPSPQITYTSSGITKLKIKIVFQDHNLKPVTGEIKLKSNKVKVFVVFKEKGKVIFKPYEKVKTGLYKPGYVSKQYNSMPEYKGRLGCNTPCDMELVKSTISQINSETTSMAQFTVASELVKNNCITVDDLALILKAFSYESDKVEFAKFAWAYVYDQENYFLLSSVFDYPQTLEEINTFVTSNQ